MDRKGRRYAGAYLRRLLLCVCVCAIFCMGSETLAVCAEEQTETATEDAQTKRLQKVKHVELIRYSTNKVKVTWDAVKKANYYRVYVARKKNGTYRLAGITKHQHFLVKKLKKNKTYYIYVQACSGETETETDSLPSAVKHIKMRTYKRKTVFAGDSLCQGVGYYAVSKMKISGKKKTVAYKGLNTITFRTKKAFGGSSGLSKVIKERPYRVYIMLGLNEVHYRKSSDVIKEYRKLIKTIQKKCPDTDIVLCAVSPVTKATLKKRPGFKNIPSLNKKLKALAKKTGTTYFDYTDFLKDKDGCLKKKYASADGFHWTVPAYEKFAKVVSKFDKSLDQ